MGTARSGISEHLGIVLGVLGGMGGMASLAAAQWTVVNLHPAGATYSGVSRVRDGQQVGWAGVDGVERAILWTGTAASWVDLNPIGATSSFARGVCSGQQVGESNISQRNHATLWTGTAASWVDLQAFLPETFADSQATGIWNDGAYTYVVGFGYNNSTIRTEALMWRSVPDCPADWTHNGVVNSADFFHFIVDFFEDDADFTHDGHTTSQDFFDFLAAFFAGC